MQAGRLRHTVIIQQRNVASRSASGEEVLTWPTFATCRASVEPLNGKEYFTARQEAAEVNYRIRLRYDSALASVVPAWRISYAGRTFDIQSIINYRERNRELIVMCKELL